MSLSVGGPAVTISEQVVSVEPSGIVIGSSTHSFSLLEGPSVAIVAFPSQTLTVAQIPDFQGVAVAGSLTFVAGGPAVTANGQGISYNPSVGLVVGGSNTIAFSAHLGAAGPTHGTGAVFSIGGSEYTALALPSQIGVVVIGINHPESMIKPWNPITLPMLAVSGNVYSGDASGNYHIATANVPTSSGVLTIPIGSAITTSGMVFSLGPSASFVVIDSITHPIAPSTGIPFPPSVIAPGPPVLTIGSKTFTANSASQYSIAPGKILTAGGQIIASGEIISLASSASYLVINGATHILTPLEPTITPPPILNIGGSVYPGNGHGSYLINSQTLILGGMVTIAGGTTLSLASSGQFIAINGGPDSTSATPVLTINGAAYTADQQGKYVITSHTLSADSAITLANGDVISLSPSRANLVVNGVTTPLTPPSLVTTQLALLTVGAQIYAASVGPEGATSYVIGSQTLIPGEVITVSSTTIILLPSGTPLAVVNGVTQTLAPAFATSNGDGADSTTSYLVGGQILTLGGVLAVSGTTIELLHSAAPLVVVNGVTETLAPALVTSRGGSATSYIIGGQTLIPGAVITVSGMTVSLPPVGTPLAVVDGVTEALATPFATPIGGSATAYIIGGQTLTLGGVITVSSMTISLLPSGIPLAVTNGVTETLATPFATPIGGSATAYIIGGQTLTLGGVITVSRTTISLLPSGIPLAVINGVTETLATPFATPIGGSATAYIISGQTLTPGGVITVSGTTVSLLPSETPLVVVNGVTETLVPSSPTSSGDAQPFTAGGVIVISGITLTPLPSETPSAVTVAVVDGITLTPLTPIATATSSASAIASAGGIGSWIEIGMSPRTSAASPAGSRTWTGGVVQQTTNAAGRVGERCWLWLAGAVALVVGICGVDL